MTRNGMVTGAGSKSHPEFPRCSRAITYSILIGCNGPDLTDWRRGNAMER